MLRVLCNMLPAHTIAVLLTAYSMWNLVEVHVAIIAACAIILRATLVRTFRSGRVYSLLRVWLPPWRRSTGNDTSSSPVRLESDPICRIITKKGY